MKEAAMKPSLVVTADWICAFSKFVAAGIPACRRAAASSAAENQRKIQIGAGKFGLTAEFLRFFRAAGCRPLRQAGMPDATKLKIKSPFRAGRKGRVVPNQIRTDRSG
jgi:hypothetical protein